MTQYKVALRYSRLYHETIEASSLEEAQDLAQDLAIREDNNVDVNENEWVSLLAVEPLEEEEDTDADDV